MNSKVFSRLVIYKPRLKNFRTPSEFKLSGPKNRIKHITWWRSQEVASQNDRKYGRHCLSSIDLIKNLRDHHTFDRITFHLWLESVIMAVLVTFKRFSLHEVNLIFHLFLSLNKFLDLQTNNAYSYLSWTTPGWLHLTTSNKPSNWPTKPEVRSC